MANTWNPFRIVPHLILPWTSMEKMRWEKLSAGGSGGAGADHEEGDGDDEQNDTNINGTGNEIEKFR